jgi:uncharacterized protein YbcI
MGMLLDKPVSFHDAVAYEEYHRVSAPIFLRQVAFISEGETGKTMTETQSERATSDAMAISNAMVRLHKDQFGRGPTKARTHFAGPDAVICILEEVLLPAERKMTEIGKEEQVRETRTSFQVATADEFIAAVEKIVLRKVHSFASAVDPKTNVIFEIFTFERRENGS